MKTLLLLLLSSAAIVLGQTLSSVSDCYARTDRSHFCARKSGISASTVPKQGWCCPFGATDDNCNQSDTYDCTYDNKGEM